MLLAACCTRTYWRKVRDGPDDPEDVQRHAHAQEPSSTNVGPVQDATGGWWASASDLHYEYLRLQCPIQEVYPSWRTPADSAISDNVLKDFEVQKLRDLYNAGFRVIGEGHRYSLARSIPASRKVVISYQYENKGVVRPKGKAKGSSERRPQSRGSSPRRSWQPSPA